MAEDVREQIARALADREAAPRGMPPYGDTSWACVRSRWLPEADALIAACPAVAEALAAVERVRAEVAEWDDATRRWYYDNRHTHPQGIDYVCGFEDGWNHAEECIRRALDGDQ